MTTAILAGLAPTLLVASGAAILMGRRRADNERPQRSDGPIRARFSADPIESEQAPPQPEPVPSQATVAVARKWFHFGKRTPIDADEQAELTQTEVCEPAARSEAHDDDVDSNRPSMFARIWNAIPFLHRTAPAEEDEHSTLLDELVRDLHFSADDSKETLARDEARDSERLGDTSIVTAYIPQHEIKVSENGDAKSSAIVAVLDPPKELETPREVTSTSNGTRTVATAGENEQHAVGGTVDTHGAIVIEAPPTVNPDLSQFAASVTEASERFAEERMSARLLEDKRTRETVAGAPWWLRLLPTMSDDDVAGRRRLASSLRRIGAEWSLALILTAYQRETEDSVRARLLGALAAHADLIDAPSLIAFMRAAEARSAIEAAAVGELGYAEIAQ
jgi:hypothetical protein